MNVTTVIKYTNSMVIIIVIYLCPFLDTSTIHQFLPSFFPMCVVSFPVTINYWRCNKLTISGGEVNKFNEWIISFYKMVNISQLICLVSQLISVFFMFC